MCLAAPPLRWRREIARLILLFVIVSHPLIGQVEDGRQSFSVKDDIAMVRFNDPPEEHDVSEQDADLYSPDGNLVAVVTTRGILSTDRVQSSISIFRLKDVASFLESPSAPPPMPRLVAAIAAIPEGQQTVAYAPMIRDLRWSADGTHLYFRGQNERGGFQLYEVGANGNGLRRLTPPSYDVDRFDVVRNTIVYTAARMNIPPPSPGAWINRDALDATGYRSKDILFPGQMKSFDAETFYLFTVHPGARPEQPRRVPLYSIRDTSMLLYTLPFQLSPDSRYVVSVEPFVGKIPRIWEQYDPVPLFEHRRLRSDNPDVTRPDTIVRPRRYALIDLRTGAVNALLNAPNAQQLGYFDDANLVAWSKDGTRVLITNSFFPIDAAGRSNASTHRKPCAVASVDIPSLRSRCLYFDDDAIGLTLGPVTDVTFGPDRDEALVTTKSSRGGQGTAVFHLLNGAWARVDMAAATQNDGASEERGAESTNRSHKIRIYLKQSLNGPPALWASDIRRNDARLLWNPNPQLNHLHFGDASVYRWKDSSGRDWTGGLVKPVGYVAGHRYPLVLQMYLFRENQFLTDGTDPSAFAAREFASAGFVVLQIRKQSNVLSDLDAEASLAGYESAIQSLADKGLIDPARVGVVGFSWTCWYVVNALVKAPRLFAAATIAEGLDNSYMQYMIFGPNSPNIQAQMNQIRGGPPWGAGLDRWVKEAPGFHLEKVQTPLRIEAMTPLSILQEWELYGSLYMQHKPVDLIYFPNGAHIHQRPQERLESQQGDVDWMRFWLQGYEDPAASKRAQYERWRQLKETLAEQHSNIQKN